MSILTELEQYIENSPNQYSSFIRPSNGQLEENFMNRKEPVGGSYTEVKFFKKYLHLFFQVLIYGLKIFNTKEFKIYRNLFKQLNRQIDEGVIRHIFTLKILNDYQLINNKICVIGDGQLNFVGGLLKINNKNLKIYSINLVEMLIHDYLSIKEKKLLEDKYIKVVNKKEDLEDNNVKLFLIDASKCELLKNIGINLFVNIASMQEMTLSFVSKYFDIIKSNKSHFYCCNRKYKKLPGGEELIFNEYPWGDGTFIFKEKCKWHDRYYESKFPYIKKHYGEHLHALIKYK